MKRDWDVLKSILNRSIDSIDDTKKLKLKHLKKKVGKILICKNCGDSGPHVIERCRKEVYRLDPLKSNKDWLVWKESQASDDERIVREITQDYKTD